MIVHSAERPFLCDICDKSFKSKIHKRIHMITHKKTVKDLKCDTCSRRFAQRRHLKIHTKYHEMGLTSACEKCNKFFESSTKLEEHMAVHARYVCSVCQKAYGKEIDLSKHIKFKHKNALPLPDLSCKLCGRQSSSESNLNTHMILVHTEEDMKAHRCNLCQKGFLRKCDLNVHLTQSHLTGETKLKTNGPLKCKHCTRTYKMKEKLEAHERLHLEKTI